MIVISICRTCAAAALLQLFLDYAYDAVSLSFSVGVGGDALAPVLDASVVVFVVVATVLPMLILLQLYVGDYMDVG
jgi:hypothetical protein